MTLGRELLMALDDYDSEACRRFEGTLAYFRSLLRRKNVVHKNTYACWPPVHNGMVWEDS